MRLGHAPMFLRLTSCILGRARDIAPTHDSLFVAFVLFVAKIPARVSRLLLTADLCQVVLPEWSLSCGVANLEAMELACVLQKKFPCLFLAKAVNIVVTYVAGETVFLFDYALVWQ